MSFCKNCGAAIGDDAQFCNFCGTKVVTTEVHITKDGMDVPLPEIQESKDIVQVNIINNTQEPPKRTTNSWMGIVGFVLSFFIYTSPISIVLGILDLILQKGRRHGLAIWGIVLGCIFSVVLIIILAATR